MKNHAVVDTSNGVPKNSKLGCVVRMVVDSILPHAECRPNDSLTLFTESMDDTLCCTFGHMIECAFFDPEDLKILS